MEQAKIYHNPACKCSNKAVEVVKESGIQFEVIEYLKSPPTVEELDEICRGLNVEPTEIIREKEIIFKELGLSKNDDRTRDEWLKIMFEHPRLIQRPIVFFNGKYALGRPPESLSRILKN